MYIVSELFQTVVRYEIAACRREVIAVIDLTHDASYKKLKTVSVHGTRPWNRQLVCCAYTFAIFPQVLASYNYRRGGCGHIGEFRNLALAKAPGCLVWARSRLPLGL
jgi:hypothetical protein